MAKLINRVYVEIATTGDGDITPGEAVDNSYCTFSEAGAIDGDKLPYFLQEGFNIEIGMGTYSTTGPTFSRDVVYLSKIAGAVGTAKIDLAGTATLRIAAIAEVIRPSGGLPFQFDSSTAMSEPDDGYLRFNNATLASVTALAINYKLATSGNPSVSAFINMLDDAGITTFVIKSALAPENFAIYQRGSGVSITDNTTWAQVAVTHIASNGALHTDDYLIVEAFMLGTDGEDGEDGATILVQADAPATTFPEGSLWIDSDSADFDLYELTGLPLAWTDTGMNLRGIDGAKAYLYVRFASDTEGTGLSATPAEGLDYIAVKSTTTEIASPVASDFTGLWKKYKGEPGAPGEVQLSGTLTAGHIPVASDTAEIEDSGIAFSDLKLPVNFPLTARLARGLTDETRPKIWVNAVRGQFVHPSHFRQRWIYHTRASDGRFSRTNTIRGFNDAQDFGRGAPDAPKLSSVSQIFDSTALGLWGQPEILSFRHSSAVAGFTILYFYLTKADLSTIGVVPDDIEPPVISLEISHVKASLSTAAAPSFEVYVHYHDGDPLEETSTAASIRIQGTSGANIASGGYAAQNNIWNHVNTLIDDSWRKGCKKEGLAIPATNGGKAFKLLELRYTANPFAGDPLRVDITRAVVIAGSTLNENATYLNWPEDFR